MQKISHISAIFKFLLHAVVCLGFIDVQAQRNLYQPQEYIFTSYTAASGLSSSEILTLAIDKKGFLWAGTTEGLSRYDGYSFTNFTHSADGHLIGIVNVIKTAASGTLWIGASSGLYCYSKNRIIKLSAETTTNAAVNDIIADVNGSLWLSTENGPVYITAPEINAAGAEKIKLGNFVLPQWTEKFAVRYGSSCHLIKKAPDGTVYFSQQYRLFRFVSGKIELIYTTTEENDKIEYILPIDRSTLYYNAASTGLHKIKNDIHTNFRFRDLYQPGRKPLAEGEWFVGSLGMVCFHAGEEFISESVAFKDAGAQWLTTVLKEKNNLWIASHSGLLKAKQAAFHLYKKAAYNSIQESFSFCELKNEQLLVGINHGKVYELNEEGVKEFLPANLQPVKHAEIKAMHEDERGWLWIGTGYQGIALYRNKKTVRFTEEANKLHDNSIYSFLSTSRGKLFAIGDKGMSEIGVDEKDNISFKPFYSGPVITKAAKFYGGVEAPDGTIWIAGEEGLCFLQHDSLHKFSLSEKGIPIRSIKITKDNQVWLATSGQGIFCCRFDENNKLQVVKQYDEKDGLNTLFYVELLIDKDDNLWAGSLKGLTFIGRTGQYKNRLVNFSEADGFIKPGYYAMKMHQDRKGVIWTGTSLGICSFLPNEILIPASAPGIYLTGIDLLKQNNNSINSDSLILIKDQHALSLPYNNNSLNFNYTAVNFSGPDAIQYFYRLKGQDTNWIAAGSRRSASFYNLPAGKYVFSVKAVNEKAEWSEGSTDFEFLIRLPFWQTGWFRLLCIIIAGIAIYLFVKNREKNIAKQEAQKTALEKLKTQSYRHQLEIEQVINFFARSIHQHNSIDETLWDVAKNLIGKLGFEDCMIYLWNNDKTILLQRAGYGIKGAMQNQPDKEMYNINKGKGIVGATVQGRQPILVNDTTKDKRYFSADGKIRLSELCVPIIRQEEVMGAINTEHTDKGFYTDRHMQILTTIASMLADRIEKLDAQQQAREKEMEVLKLNSELATSQLTSLRSQMNPHFLFNAMNSIQQFTLMGDMENANLYISKFSTLLRKVLHSSKLNYLSLEEEIEQLRLYLDIEKLRLGKDFGYEIKIDDEIETDTCMIPGMLIQPFVENSVKHGLALKEGEKKLQIDFHFAAENTITATITDNGIGRDKAGLLKEQQEKLLPHRSEGIQLVEERLRLLSQVPAAEKSIIIKDIRDASGKARGTQVQVVLPVLPL